MHVCGCVHGNDTEIEKRKRNNSNKQYRRKKTTTKSKINENQYKRLCSVHCTYVVCTLKNERKTKKKIERCVVCRSLLFGVHNICVYIFQHTFLCDCLQSLSLSLVQCVPVGACA